MNRRRHSLGHDPLPPTRRRYLVRRLLVLLLAFGVVTVTTGAAQHLLRSTPAAALPHRQTHTTTTTVPVRTVTMSFVGDTDLGSTPQLPPNAGSYLTPVRAALRAPLQFFNLEGTLTNSTGTKCGAHATNCYAFRNPPTFAHIYKYDGFTVANSANNHSHDFGAQGVNDTTAALHAAAITQAGLPGQVGMVIQGGVKIAFVDFAPYVSTNNLLNYATATALIHQAKKQANVVVVYMHAGAEGSNAQHVTGHEEFYVGEDRGNAELFATMAIKAGASVVVASGPHVLRGMEFYRGHLIAYSLGNFAGYRNFATGGVLGLSGILHVTLTSAGGFVGATFTSTVLDSQGRPALDSTHASAHFVESLSRSDFGAAAPYIRTNGHVVPPAG